MSEKVITYLIGECPKCGHMWRIKGTDNEGRLRPEYDLPRSCPRCKYRFDADWSEELKTSRHKFKNYREWLKWRKQRAHA